jgi:hypothetical protein
MVQASPELARVTMSHTATAVEAGVAFDLDHLVMITHIPQHVGSFGTVAAQTDPSDSVTSSLFKYKSVPMESGFYGMSPAL